MQIDYAYLVYANKIRVIFKKIFYAMLHLIYILFTTAFLDSSAHQEHR